MTAAESIREFIVDNFLFGDDDGFAPEASFLENGLVDSVGIMELVSFLEETFNIEIQDDELIPDNLDSLQNIARFIRHKISNTE